MPRIYSRFIDRKHLEAELSEFRKACPNVNVEIPANPTKLPNGREDFMLSLDGVFALPDPERSEIIYRAHVLKFAYRNIGWCMS